MEANAMMKRAAEGAKVAFFKHHWYNRYSYISLECTDSLILEYIYRYGTIEKAADLMADYLVSQGLADVQE